jgi:hypothetical protein
MKECSDMKNAHTASVALVVLLFANAAAQTKDTDRRFEVVGQDGTIVVTGHLRYSAQYAYPVYDGVLFQQASGETKALWTRLKSVNITASETRPGELRSPDADLIFADGKTAPKHVKLTPGDLQGTTDLGEYSASINDLKRITPLSTGR